MIEFPVLLTGSRVCSGEASNLDFLKGLLSSNLEFLESFYDF
jgi:hypothetical protein